MVNFDLTDKIHFMHLDLDVISRSSLEPLAVARVLGSVVITPQKQKISSHSHARIVRRISAQQVFATAWSRWKSWVW